MLEKWTVYYSYTAKANLALEIKTDQIKDDYRELVGHTFPNSALQIEFLPDHEIRKERYLNHLSYTSVFNYLQVRKITNKAPLFLEHVAHKILLFGIYRVSVFVRLSA